MFRQPVLERRGIFEHIDLSAQVQLILPLILS